MTPDNKLVEALRELRDVNLAIYASGIRAPDLLRSLLDAAIGRAGTALSQPVPSAPEPSHDKPIAWWSGGEYGGGDEHGRLSLGTFTEHEDTRHDIPVYAGWNNEGKPSRNAPDNAPVPAAAPAIEPTEAIAALILDYGDASFECGEYQGESAKEYAALNAKRKRAFDALLASRPQRPQAETPLTDEQIEELALEHEAFGFGRVDARGLTTHGFDPGGLRAFARALLAHPNTGAHPPEAGPTHRHIKRGTFYTERGRGMLQTDRTLEDEAELVGYQGTDGRWWFRPVEEFDDAARFERVASPPEARADAGLRYEYMVVGWVDGYSRHIQESPLKTTDRPVYFRSERAPEAQEPKT